MKILHGIATESAGVLDFTETSDPDVLDVTIIQPGWGNSGYYSEEMLTRDYPKFVKGTRSFIDHNGEVESAKTVIGVLTENARLATNKAGQQVVKAPIRFMKTGQYNAEWIKERAGHGIIELSQRSYVEYGQGEAEGRTGKIVAAITEALSVDVVARGGAGGKFGVIEESARIGSPAHTEKEEGSDMPLTKEEKAELAQESAALVIAGLKPTLDGFTTAIGDLKKSQESQPVALTSREINKKITDAKLPEAAEARVYDAVEKEGFVPTDDAVTKLVAEESARMTEALTAARAALGVGNVVIDESTGKPVAQENAPVEAGTVRWGSNRGGKAAVANG